MFLVGKNQERDIVRRFKYGKIVSVEYESYEPKQFFLL